MQHYRRMAGGAPPPPWITLNGYGCEQAVPASVKAWDQTLIDQVNAAIRLSIRWGQAF